MDALAYVLTSGWASGISVYATVLVTGLAGRIGVAARHQSPLGCSVVALILLVAGVVIGTFLIRKVREGLIRLCSRYGAA